MLIQLIFLFILQATLSAGDESVACDGQQIKLKCPENQLLYVKDAIYGRNDPKVCPDDNAFFQNDNNCTSDKAIEIVSDKCNDEQNCTLEVSNKVFGNPCEKTTEYLTVEYTCVKVEKCSGNETFTTCKSTCEKTCVPSTSQKPCSCNSGCTCKNGYVRQEHGGECVKESSCSNDGNYNIISKLVYFILIIKYMDDII